MQCPRCLVEDIIEIHHTLPDGTEVDFYSCHKCDEKWWQGERGPIELHEVLDLARKPRS